MEEKFDTIISLLETQNKAWQKSLQILDGIYTVLSNQYMKDERLLQEHPAIREPAADQPVTVGYSIRYPLGNRLSLDIPINHRRIHHGGTTFL